MHQADHGPLQGGQAERSSSEPMSAGITCQGYHTGQDPSIHSIVWLKLRNPSRGYNHTWVKGEDLDVPGL